MLVEIFPVKVLMIKKVALLIVTLLQSKKIKSSKITLKDSQKH